jgi:putative spermidine/putrescine transport system permease protein
MSATSSNRSLPYWLSLPGVVLFTAMLMVPLAMTFMLSFYSFKYDVGIQPGFSLHNYQDVFTDSYFYEIFWRTFRYGLLVTALAVLIGVPEAYFLSRMRAAWRTISLLAIIGPLLISVVVRTLGWVILMGNNGLLNRTLEAWNLPNIPFVYTETGVVIVLLHVMMPFMIVSVWATLQKIDPATENAAASLGASRLTIFFRVIFPQAIPGVLSGSLIVFSMSTSAFATPVIIGGRRLKVASTTIYDEFLSTLEWPLGAAIAIVLLVGITAVVISYNKLIERRYAQVFQ